MKTTTRIVLVLALTLLAIGTLAVIGQPAEPPPTDPSEATADQEDLEEFVPTERVSFDKAISLPVDI